MSKLKTAVILAGGKSTRMKFDKQRIKIDGKYLVRLNIIRLKKYFEDIIIVTNTPDFYNGLNVRTMDDIYPGYGPISGIHAALSRSLRDFVYVLAVDMPKVDLDYISLVDDLYEEDKDGLVFSHGSYIEPMQGIYHKRLVPLMEKMIADKSYRISDLVKLSNFMIIKEESLKKRGIGLDLFDNLNTQAQLTKYRDKFEN